MTEVGGKDSYPAWLERILNQRNIGVNFSVVNKGKTGINTFYILAHLEENLNKYNPDMVTAMIGINDGGMVMYPLSKTSSYPPPDKHIKYYEDIPEANTALFKTSRAYRFLRILWQQLIQKIRKKGIYKPEGDKKVFKSGFRFSTTGLKECYAAQMEPEQAEEALKKAIELYSENYNAYRALLCSYTDQAKYTEAEELLKKLIKLNPKDDQLYVDLGHLYTLQARFFSEGEMALKKAIELNPKNEQAHIELGSLYRCQAWVFYRREGNFSKVEELLKKSIEINPRDINSCVELARLYKDRGNLSRAEEMLKKATALEPGQDDRAAAGLAMLYEEMGKSELAQEYYRKANRLRLENYSLVTTHNYQELKMMLDKRGIKLVCIQYPLRSIEPLKRMLQGQDGVIFVDNEKVFKDALKKGSFKDYFIDMFGGEFGHCTPEGNRLLAQNLANVILKEYFNK
jgi:tetratricopeptide (TPR) repeat protein